MRRIAHLRAAMYLGPREIIGGQFSSVNSWYAKNILKGL